MECVLLDFWLHLGSASLSCISSLPSFHFSPIHAWSNPPPCPPQLEVGVGLQPCSQAVALCVFLIWGNTQRAGPSAEALASGWVPSSTAGCRQLPWACPSTPGSSRRLRRPSCSQALCSSACARSSLSKGRFRPLLRAELLSP